MSLQVEFDIATGIHKLSGVISEETDLMEVFGCGNAEIVLDLGGVSRINSAGVRSLVVGLEKVPGDTVIRLRECPSPVVYHMATIPQIVMRCRVDSVYVPYFCEACEAMTERIMNMAGKSYPPTLPKESCKDCGAALILDDRLESYFYFMRWMK